MTVVSSPCAHANVKNENQTPKRSALRILDCPDSSYATTHLEAGDSLDVVGQNVKLLLGTLIVVSLPLQPDPDSVRGRSNTSGPNGLVETGGDSNVLDAHRLLSKLDNGLDGLGSPCG